MGHAVFVFGAAGAGKTTFCRNIREHARPSGQIRLVNLDPAYRDASDYDVDLCDHITVEDVMENCDFGPNGGLFAALEEMVDNLEVLNLQEFEDSYFIFDCPGQIELFLHSNIMQGCVKHVKGFAKVAVVYLTDATNFITSDKHLYASFCATICMSRFCLPTLNIVSKVDLIDAGMLERILGNEDLNPGDHGDSEYGRLSRTILEYVEYSGMLDYLPLNWNDDEMVNNVIMQLDNVLQRSEDIEPTEKGNGMLEY